MADVTINENMMDDRKTAAIAAALSGALDRPRSSSATGPDIRHQRGSEDYREQGRRGVARGGGPHRPHGGPEEETEYWSQLVDSMVSGSKVDVDVDSNHPHVDRKRERRISAKDRASKFVIEPWMVLCFFAVALTTSFFIRTVLPILERLVFPNIAS